MIKSIKRIRNLGPFETVQNVKLGKVTLIYAENGRGKTMLSEALRSLATGAPELVAGRSRLGSDAEPVIVLGLSNDEEVRWTQTSWKCKGKLPKVSVFNDGFVDANVYSGLDVTSSHRQGLHSVVVGEEGVRLADAYRAANSEVERLRKKKDNIGREITSAVGMRTSVEDFVALVPCDEIDSMIKENQTKLQGAKRASAIGQRQLLKELPVPDLPVDEVRERLKYEVSAATSLALREARKHINAMWPGAESWVHEGLVKRDDSGECPFCKQDLASSPVFNMFEHYFNDAYRDAKQNADQMLEKFEEEFANSTRADFDRLGEENARLIQEWVADGISDPDPPKIDHSEVSALLESLRQGMIRALKAKVNAPLEVIEFDRDTLGALRRLPECEQLIRDENKRITEFNLQIKALRESAGGWDSSKLEQRAELLRLTKARGTDDVLKLCEKYENARKRQIKMEESRKDSLEELKRYNQGTFAEYGQLINAYLRRFGAGFTINGLKDTVAGGTPACEYVISIIGGEVPVKSKMSPDHQPSFRNTLSAGDRTSLALAFFLASLDTNTDLKNSVVVIDDPISSLDDGRRAATVARILRTARSCAQIVVMSHDVRFLGKVAAKLQPRSSSTPNYEIMHRKGMPVLEAWDVGSASEDEAVSRAARLQRFADGEDDDPRVIDRDVRLHLETVLQLNFPSQFPVGTSIWEFERTCRQSAENGIEIVSPEFVNHLDELRDFSNNPHHTGSERSNKTELRPWITSMFEMMRGMPI